MPSPFPGMDPYLEDPARWPDVHNRLINLASDQLTAQLRPKYVARIEERVYLSDGNDPGRKLIVPDVHISMRDLWEGVRFEPGNAAGVDIAEPIEVTTVLEDEIHEARIEVIDPEDRSVVAVIEVLSPSNKLPGSQGAKSFEAKRREIMDTNVHWVEIDLLREGRRVQTYKSMTGCEYLVYVSRADRRPRATAWPIRLSQRLPVIAVPLKPEDPDAKLDLQAMLTTAYDRAGYDLDVKYDREPVPPLPPEWAKWSDELLKAKKLREV